MPLAGDMTLVPGPLDVFPQLIVKLTRHEMAAVHAPHAPFRTLYSALRGVRNKEDAFTTQPQPAENKMETRKCYVLLCLITYQGGGSYLMIDDLPFASHDG